MLAIDYVWLSIIAKNFYKTHLEHLLTSNPNFFTAGLFYIIYGMGITFFIIIPALKDGSSNLIKIFLTGAFFGFIAYSAYDLTNHSTLKNWPTIVTVVDLLWGSLLTGTIAVIAFSITKQFS